MEPQMQTIDSTTNDWNKVEPNEYVPDYSNRFDHNELPTVNSTNPNYHPTSLNNSHISERTNGSMETAAEKMKGELKKGHANVEDIITKSKRIFKQHWNQTLQNAVLVQKKVKDMVPKQANDLIYWKNPIKSGVVFGVLLSIIITFMFLSSLAAVAFWLLALLIVIGLYKLYNYVMITFLGRAQEDIFDSVFSSDVNITDRQAQALANYIRANGTSLLRQARSLFLWNNLANSLVFGLTLFCSFYIGLSMNALTFALVGLIFVFTVPKIYQVYQVPIDRTARQLLDQINQLLAKATAKGLDKAKKP